MVKQLHARGGAWFTTRVSGEVKLKKRKRQLLVPTNSAKMMMLETVPPFKVFVSSIQC